MGIETFTGHIGYRDMVLQQQAKDTAEAHTGQQVNCVLLATCLVVLAVFWWW